MDRSSVAYHSVTGMSDITNYDPVGDHIAQAAYRAVGPSWYVQTFPESDVLSFQFSLQGRCGCQLIMEVSKDNLYLTREGMDHITELIRRQVKYHKCPLYKRTRNFEFNLNNLL